jgi:putative chitinase
MNFDRPTFYRLYKQRFGLSLNQSQVDGLNFLLDSIEADPLWKDVRHIAYALATVAHETAWSYLPVEEGYYLGNADRVKRFQKTLRYYPYYGRGYVQLTWKANYHKAGDYFGVNLVGKPERVLEPELSYKILAVGMHQGWFTGKKLDTYINDTLKDYKAARRIINGTDKAALIAGHANKFEDILRGSRIKDPKPVADSSAKDQPAPVSGGAQVDQTNDPAAPPVVSADKEPAGTIGSTISGAADAVTGYLNKTADVQAGVAKVPFVSQFLTKGLGLLGFATAFITENWELALIAFVIFVVAAWYLTYARRKAAHEE